MAKLVIICVALLAFQGAELSEPNTFLEKTPEHLARLIETDTREYVNFLESHGYNYEVESSIKHYVERVESIVSKLQLKSHIKNGRVELTLEELTEKLRKILQILQNPKLVVEDDFPRYLLEIAGIFEKLAEYTKTGEQSIEVHQLLQNLLIEYCFTIKNAVRMLASPEIMHSSPLKMRLESDLKEIMDNLKHVDFDNVHVKRTMIDMVHNYVRGLEKTIPKEVLAHFEVFLRRCEAMNALECRKELTTAFDNLRTVIKGRELDQNRLMQLLAATNVLEFKIYNMCVTNVPHGETTTSFGLQIRTVSSGVINTLRSLSFEDRHAKQILMDQTHELIVNLKSITEKLDEAHFTPVQVVKGELNKIIVELKRVVESFHDMEEGEIKTTLTKCIQGATTQIEKLLRMEHENKDPQTSPVYEIFNDYLAILQHQLIQFQNIYQSTTEKQPITHMGNQIQTITNSVIVYLRNVPTNDVMIREKLEVQVHHLIKRVQAILVRVRDINDPNFTKIIQRISKITQAFESFMERTQISAINEVVFHFNILVQQVGVEMKNLAWLGQSAKLEDVVRSVMGEYLIIIENIQVKIQRINQVAQVGQSPRELALQIEVVAEHLRQMLVVFVSDNPLAKRTFMWEIRHFERVLETVADQLLSKEVSQSGKVYKEVGSNLKQVVMELRRSEKDAESADIYQYRMKVVNKIVKVAEEVQKLCWISQADIQEGLGVQTTYIRSILLELLLSLQNFHIQMMHNFQVVASGQSPSKILAEIEQIPKTLFGQLQAIKSEIDLEQILTIQLGEYLQTIENTLNSIHHEMKNNGEHNVEIEKIADMLGKMSLLLQNVNVKDVKEFWTKFELSLNEFIQGMHTLVAMNFEKVSKTHVGTHTGILHGVLSNMLATLRNMYIQLYYSQHGTEVTKINELGDRIAVITNNIMPTLETIVGSTTPIKQALDVQIFKYSRNLQYLINKIDKELGESNIKEVKEVQTKLRLSLTVLRQTASSMSTLTINDLKLHFNKLIQGVGAEIQKLVILQTTNKETHDVIRHLLLHYLKTLKNVHIQIQNISRMSHQSENYQLVAMEIDTAIIELCKYLQVLPQNHNLLAKVIVVESHEMAQLILNIINRYQAAAVVQDNDLFMEIATELKKIQLFLQNLNESTVLNDFNNFIVKLASHMERAAVLIEQLMWMPVKTVHGAQYRPDMPTFVRVTLHDFLSAVQNMFVQIANVIVHVDDKSFDEILHGKTHQNAQNLMEMPKSDILYRPELELYKGLVKKETPMVTNERNKWNLREYEHVTMPDSHRIPHTSSWPRSYQNGMMPSGYNQPMMSNPWYYPQMTASTYGPNMMYQMPQNTMVKQRNWWYPAAPTQYYPERMMPNGGMHQPAYYTDIKTMYQHQHQPEPKQVVENIEKITKKISNTLMNKPIEKDTILTQIRQLTTVLEEISRKMQVEQIADNLRNLKLAFDNIIKRSTIMNLDQMKKEICHNLEMVSKQFEDLVMIHETRTSTLVNTVLERYNNHLQMTWRELQNYSINQKY
ncbi:hypothetical protein RI129_012547 [Pyrocoelia pectoralis]|uniref:Uncharacterized protein n=1 Tax=Pyrocoelia pectoralis TaxID=417401 RepID=A0AAN7ZC72_9COLE